MESRQRRNLAGIVLGVLLVVGFGLSRVLGGISGEPGATCEDPVAWHQAMEEVGESSAIVGEVVSANHEPDIGGSPTFLNLGNAFPDDDRFDVVIYEDVRDRFEEAPGDTLVGEYVCILGEVRERDGVPQIVLQGPGWLWVEDGVPPGL